MPEPVRSFAHYSDVPERLWHWPSFSPAEIACRGTGQLKLHPEALDRLQAAKGGDDFEVIAISVDHGSDEKPRAFFDEIGIEHLGFYHDPTIGAFNAVKKEGMALGLPATMLIDENNCVVANMNGPANWASEDALKMVDAVTKRDM